MLFPGRVAFALCTPVCIVLVPLPALLASLLSSRSMISVAVVELVYLHLPGVCVFIVTVVVGARIGALVIYPAFAAHFGDSLRRTFTLPCSRMVCHMSRINVLGCVFLHGFLACAHLQYILTLGIPMRHGLEEALRAFGRIAGITHRVGEVFHRYVFARPRGWSPVISRVISSIALLLMR